MERLHRSKSDCDTRVKEAVLGGLNITSHHFKPDGIKERRSYTDKQISLKQEINQLEKRLHAQLVLRQNLEGALQQSSYIVPTPNDSLMPKSTVELVRDISVLEFEVRNLEKYLLSIYRGAFEQNPHLLTTSTSSSLRLSSRFHFPISEEGNFKSYVNTLKRGTFYSVNRSKSSLSQISDFSTLPSFEKYLPENENSGLITLAECLGTKVADHVPETPNRISEEMVRCMSAIYCKLADPPMLKNCISTSPSSSFSSMSASSPQYVGDMWSPSCRKESTLDRRLQNPFLVEGLYEVYGPYNAMVEVASICRDKAKLNDVKDLLHDYRLLVQRLERVDPRKMTNEERLSFWINIHNAIIMHAYLDYGIPQNNYKRASLLTKARCIVGNRVVTANILQGSILGCRTHNPGQWIRLLLSPRSKHGDEWQDYAINQPEPLLYFALCSGSHSSPAVRIYTKKQIFHQLQVAKEEYIRATFAIKKEEKILLPKIVESYAKESGLNLQGMMDTIQHYLPETIRIVIQRCQREKSQKPIEWIPNNFSFRYLLLRELVAL